MRTTSALLIIFGLTLGASALPACKSDAPPPSPATTTAPETTAPATSPPAADAATTPEPDATTTPEPDAATAPEPDAATADAPASPAATRLRLLVPGAEPRLAPRYALVAGLEQRAALAMSTELELGATGQRMPTALPKTRMLLTATVGPDADTASPERETTVRLAIAEAGLAPGAEPGPTRAGERLAEVIRALRGLEGQKLVSARGLSRRFSLAFPEGHAGPDTVAALAPIVQGFERAIDQMTVPLPAEPIGVGAKWEVQDQVEEAGMMLDQTTTFEATAVARDKLTLRFAVTLAAPPGELAGTLAGGLSAKVKSLSGSGEGTIEVDLTRPLPKKLSGENRIVLSLELASDGEPRPLDVEMRVTLAVTDEAQDAPR